MTTPLPREQFPVTERYRYFDHAGVSPIPKVAADATRWWIDRTLTKGKVDYDELEARQASARATAAALMGVPTNDVAFIKNTTEGLAFVAAGLDWHDGDRVVIPDHEFPSAIYPFLALEERGVKVDLVTPVGDARALPLEAFERVIGSGPAPKLVVVSWVQFARGWRTDIAGLARLAHEAGALFCVDAIQGVGLVPAHFEDWGVDVAMAGAHKWMLGPEGIGVVYVAERIRERVRPTEPGWASMAHDADYDNLTVAWADSARRYEGGTANNAGTAAFDASLRLIESTGVERIWRHVDALCDRLVAALGNVPHTTVLSDRSAEGRSGIVSIRVDGQPSEQTAHLLNGQRFVCSARGGGVRIAPHGYNTVDEIDALVASVAAAADQQDRQPERN
ncbi:MAG TPA: aminotransferase class V-fold PLP-dependent enzyme [Acidimicrobiales bacterium]|nr:aminotransferase class V-fold PLP-dependent enzyme [Acidimicrobiales bacterium]